MAPEEQTADDAAAAPPLITPALSALTGMVPSAAAIAAVAINAVAAHGREHAGAAWLHAHDRLAAKGSARNHAAAAVRAYATYDPAALDPVQETHLASDLSEITGQRSGDQNASMEDAELRHVVSRILMSLTPREERTLRMRYGIGDSASSADSDDGTMSLGQTAAALGVSVERARQIEWKGVRKCRHPSRSRALRAALDGDASVSLPDEPFRIGIPAPTFAWNRGVHISHQGLEVLAEARVPGPTGGSDARTAEMARAIMPACRMMPDLLVDLELDPYTGRHRIIASHQGFRNDVEGPPILGGAFVLHTEVSTIGGSVRLLDDLAAFLRRRMRRAA